MVHDLTANSDFQSNRRLKLFDRLANDFKSESDNLTSPYDEIVLTGASSDRDHKRYVLDYESDQKNMCDCCGAPIRNKPWDFEENRTLCPKCEKWLEETHNSRESGELLQEVIKDTRLEKPWDVRDFERENATDNVLLWD